MGFAVFSVTQLAPLLHPQSTTAPLPRVPLASAPPPSPPISPVAPPASAEAMVMENASHHQDAPAGIEFDDVPFTGDAAILVDDIIQAKVERAKVELAEPDPD